MSKLSPVIEVGKEEDAGKQRARRNQQWQTYGEIIKYPLCVFLPRVPVSSCPRITASLCLRIYRLATRINKNIPIPKKTKLGNQAPIKGDKTPACAIAPLIKKIK